MSDLLENLAALVVGLVERVCALLSLLGRTMADLFVAGAALLVPGLRRREAQPPRPRRQHRTLRVAAPLLVLGAMLWVGFAGWPWAAAPRQPTLGERVQNAAISTGVAVAAKLCETWAEVRRTSCGE